MHETYRRPGKRRNKERQRERRLEATGVMETVKDVLPHLCQVFAGLALVLVAAGVKVAGDGRDAQVGLPIFDKDVLQVVSPHGPGFHQHIVHLDRGGEGLVGLF